ncbi:BTAD domain-containing putative transcriptional regulator [Streptomyces sp. NPDC001928]|uniref:AfsR/SARP family transcriptional regulator n=1 Tax=Streptomyces sp. NPDC001928 TaxID=3154404 RepID=UPI00331CBE7C
MEIRLLGPVQAWADGAAIDVGRPRQRCVLAVLLMEANRVVPIETLIDRVWGDDPPASVRNVVYGYIGRLKTALGGSGPAATDIRLNRVSGGYELRVPDERVDLYSFRDLVARARDSDDDRAAELLRGALELWRGEPLSGVTGAWADTTRAGLAGERIDGWLRYHEVQLRRARHSEILPRLRELAAAHPLDERLAGQLLTALYRCGLPAEALLHYDAVRKRLAEDLGVDPSQELQALHQLIVTNDPTLAAPTPRRSGVPAELPHDAAGFAGRTDELARLHALLDSGPANTVVISAIGGAAGIGKTALAVRWAHQARSRFPDGQLYVNLHGFDHDRPPLASGEALELLLRSLGLEASEIPPTDEAQARVYRSLLAGRRLLVLLDNAASAEQVRPLLPGSASCCVVVTSRNRLGDLVAHDGAHALPLDLLLPAEARALLGEALGKDRLSAEPPEVVEDLIRLCGSLPLALRVAAARLAGDPGLRLADLVAEMSEGDRLQALAPDDTGNSPLRTAFSASYRVLSPGAQRLFRLLGLFPGAEFTVEVAAALLDVPVSQARRLLGGLAAAHLIEAASAGRYRFHDLLREYAREQARVEEPPADRDAAVKRLLLWYLSAARATGGSWLFPELPPELVAGDQPAVPSAADAGRWLDAERANLLALINHAGRYGPRPVAWHLANALIGDFWLHLPRATWQATAQTGLDAATAEGDLFGQVAMHSSLGLLKSDRGRGGQALEHNTRACEISRELGWATGEAAGLGGLAQTEWGMARLRSSHEHVTAGLRLTRAAGNRHLEALGLVVLGVTCRDLGRLSEAAVHLESAISRNQEVGWNGNGLVLPNLGWVYWELGRLTDGLETLAPWVTPSRRGGHRSDSAMMLNLVARINIELGHDEEALEQAERALAMGKGRARRWIQAGILDTIAGAHRRLGSLDRSMRAGSQAVALAREAGYRRIEAECVLGLSLVQQQMGRYDDARAHAEQALTLARDHAFGVVEGQALTALSATATSQGSHTTAAALGKEALAIHRRTGHRLGEARTLLILGRGQEARDIFTDVGVPARE